MVPPVRIVGSYLSPYVRKILVALDLKRVAYEIDPIVPNCAESLPPKGNATGLPTGG